MDNLASYTAPGAVYPEFCSAYLEGDQVTLMVRGEAHEGVEGPQATIVMPVEQFKAFICTAQNEMFRLWQARS
jgi:hypothetical protein